MQGHHGWLQITTELWLACHVVALPVWSASQLALFWAQNIHLKVMLCVVSSNPHLFTLLAVFPLQNLASWVVIIVYDNFSSFEVIVPFCDCSVYSVSFLFCGAPFPLCVHESMLRKGY